MTADDSVHVDDEGTQLLASEQSGDVLVAIFAPTDATTAEVRRASTRASEIAQNELAFHDVREEADEDTDDYQQEDDPDRRDEDGTKYGHQGVGETVLTDGGFPEGNSTSDAAFATIEDGERVERTEEEILDDLVDRGIARPIGEHDRAGQSCRNRSCEELVPENSHKSLNLGASSGYCSLACLLDEDEDRTDGGTDTTATVDLPTPASVIDETLAPIDVDGKTAALARNLARTLSGTQYAIGKRPGVLAAACVYLADVVCCPPSGDPITQRAVSRATGVSRASIRNHYQRIAVVCHRADPNLGDERFASWVEAVSLEEPDKGELLPDGGIDVQELTSGKLEVAFAVSDLEQSLVERPTSTGVVEYLADAGHDISASNVKKSLKALFEMGVLDRERGRKGDDEKFRPDRYWPTAEGRSALRSHVERRVEQVGYDTTAQWVSVHTRDDLNSDRVVNDIFCDECGNIKENPEDELCQDCQADKPRDEMIADGGVDQSPIEIIRADRSKAVRIDYPNGRKEVLAVGDGGVLRGIMDGKGPFPADDRDARIVCKKYDAEILDRADLDAEFADLVADGGAIDREQMPAIHSRPWPGVPERCIIVDVGPDSTGDVGRNSIDELVDGAGAEGQESSADPDDHASDASDDETDDRGSCGSRYVLEDSEDYLTTRKVSRADGLDAGGNDVADLLGLNGDETVTYWWAPGAGEVHVSGPDGPDPPPGSVDVRTAPTRDHYGSAKFGIAWTPLEAIGAEDGGYVRLYDGGDRLIIRPANDDADDAEAEPSDAESNQGATSSATKDDDDEPDDPDEGGPVASTKTRDRDRRQVAVPLWSGLDVDVPDGVTPDQLREAVDRSDSLLEVCGTLGLPPSRRDDLRVLAKHEDLYKRLNAPEAGPLGRRSQ